MQQLLRQPSWPVIRLDLGLLGEASNGWDAVFRGAGHNTAHTDPASALRDISLELYRTNGRKVCAVFRTCVMSVCRRMSMSDNIPGANTFLTSRI